MADGTEFIIDIPINSPDLVATAGNVDALSRALEKATAASTSAAAAVGASKAKYAEAMTAADGMAKALERVDVKLTGAQRELTVATNAGDVAGIEAAEKKIANLTARQTELQGAAASAQSEMMRAAEALDASTAAAAEAATKQGELAEALKQAEAAQQLARDRAREAAAAQAEFGGAVARALGPVGEMGRKVIGVFQAFGRLAASGPAGILLGVGTAAVAVVAGIAAAGLAIGRFALNATMAARQSALMSQGLVGSVAGGLALEEQINSLGGRVPLATDKIRGLAADLAKTGLRGDALGKALEEAAKKSAEAEFGPGWEGMMLDTSVMADRLRQNIGRIFSGLKLDKALAEMRKVVDLFDSNSAAAQAIKVVFESAFQPLVNGAAAAIPKVVAWFLQLEIAALKTLIAMANFSRTHQKEIGLVVAGVQLFVGGMMQAASIVATIVGAWAGAFMWVGGVGASAFIALRTGVETFKAWLSSVSLAEIGMALVDGLTGGIASKAASVVSAVTGLATGAIAAARKALDSHSPSRVFAALGVDTAEGMALGVEEGAPGVTSAVESMVMPPDVPAPAGSTSTTSTSSASTVVYQITVNGEGNEDMIGKLEALLVRLHDGQAQAVGGLAVA